MFSHFVLVCQLLDASYGLQLYQAVGGVVLHLGFPFMNEGIDQSMLPRLKSPATHMFEECLLKALPK